MITSWGTSGQRFIVRAFVFTILTVHSSASFALIIKTANLADVALFQAGATVENFDNLSALPITSYASGQTVPPANRFSSRNLAAFTAPFFNSGGATFTNPIANPGTQIGIFDPGGAIAGEVKSPNNVAGPLAGGSDQAFGNGFMEVIFPTDVRRVGFWLTHGNFQLILKDSNNMNLATGDFAVNGIAGEFIGIQRDTADVRGVTLGFTDAFTLDDFTFATTAIPEPASILLAAFALGALLGFRRTR